MASVAADPDERDMTPVGASTARPGSGSNAHHPRRSSGAAKGAADQGAHEQHADGSSTRPPMSPRAPQAEPKSARPQHRQQGGSLPVLAGSASSSRRGVASGGSHRPATSRSTATTAETSNNNSSLPPPGSGAGTASARDHSVLLTQQLLLERQYWCTKYTFTGLRARIERRLYQRELTAMWSERTEHSPYWSNQTKELASAEKRVVKWRVNSARSPRQSLMKLVNGTRFDEPAKNGDELPSQLLHWSPLSQKAPDPEVSQEAAMAAVRVSEESPKRQSR